MTAHDLFIRSLSRLRYRGDGWLSDFLHLWLDPEERIHCDFAGENAKVRVWHFRIAGGDVTKFREAIPEAVLVRTNVFHGHAFSTFKVSAPKLARPG